MHLTYTPCPLLGPSSIVQAKFAPPLFPPPPLLFSRWLRFPCCGERYPCDLCHEEGVADGHPVAWAKRMVCGYCSVEQPCAPRCANCLRKLAATGHNPSGTHSRFWEGGKGERDPRRLDRCAGWVGWGGGKWNSAQRGGLLIGCQCASLSMCCIALGQWQALQPTITLQSWTFSDRNHLSHTGGMLGSIATARRRLHPVNT